MTDDLIERLERANATLLDMAEAASRKSDYDNKWRLESKAEGVRLALSYIREERVILDDYQLEQQSSGFGDGVAGDDHLVSRDGDVI